MNCQSDIVNFFGGRGGVYWGGALTSPPVRGYVVLERGALIREWAVIRSFTVSDSVLLESLQLTHGLTHEWLPLLGSILSVLFDGVLVILTDDRESVACHVGTLLLTRRHLLKCT